MTFPLPHTVQHLAYSGEGRNSRGNVVDVWADPVDVPAFWHTGPTHEPQIAGHERVRVDAKVYVDRDLSVSAKDKFVLPRWGEFEVEGEPEDYNSGPFGWAPGLVALNLRKVTG